MLELSVRYGGVKVTGGSVRDVREIRGCQGSVKNVDVV